MMPGPPPGSTAPHARWRPSRLSALPSEILRTLITCFNKKANHKNSLFSPVEYFWTLMGPRIRRRPTTCRRRQRARGQPRSWQTCRVSELKNPYIYEWLVVWTIPSGYVPGSPHHPSPSQPRLGSSHVPGDEREIFVDFVQHCPTEERQDSW